MTGQNLARRLKALEGSGMDSALSHLTDEQLAGRMVELCHTFTDAGFPPPDGWQQALASNNAGFLSPWIAATKAELQSCEA